VSDLYYSVYYFPSLGLACSFDMISPSWTPQSGSSFKSENKVLVKDLMTGGDHRRLTSLSLSSVGSSL